MARVQATMPVLNEMQELDQQIAATGPLAQNPADLVEGIGLDLTTAWQSASAPAAGTWMDRAPAPA